MSLQVMGGLDPQTYVIFGVSIPFLGAQGVGQRVSKIYTLTADVFGLGHGYFIPWIHWDAFR